MKSLVRILCLVGSFAILGTLIAVPALAGVHPSITSMSTHRATYWGGTAVTVRGHNFSRVQKVMFGSKRAWNVQVVSATQLEVSSPYHGYGKTYVRVVTSNGWSAKGTASKITFVHPTMNSHIQGGLTGKQEQRISAQVRHAHRAVHTAARSRRWTPAMGVTAAQRARSWLGLPYSWAGGNAGGPTKGVCAHNGGDLDCHVVGVDCSGLTLYSWAPYKHLVHSAAVQHGSAGRFHPTIGQLVPGDLVFFSAYIPNGIGHTAVYEGHGDVIQAEESGTTIMRSKLSDVIRFSGKYRGATRPTSTGKQAPGPQLTSRTTRITTRGGTLTLRGHHLSNATTVVIGKKTYYSFAKRSASHLVVKVGAHGAGKVAVAVSNPWGTATTSFSYTAAPHISTLGASAGPVAGGNTVTVNGTNFVSVKSVSVGTKRVAFHLLSTRRLTFTMPAYGVGAMTVKVGVAGAYGTSNAKSYTYLEPTPPRTTAPPSTTPPPATTPPPSTTPPSSKTLPPATPTTTVPARTSTAPSTTSTTPSTTTSTTPSTTRTSTTPAPTPAPTTTSSSAH